MDDAHEDEESMIMLLYSVRCMVVSQYSVLW